MPRVRITLELSGALVEGIEAICERTRADVAAGVRASAVTRTSFIAEAVREKLERDGVRIPFMVPIPSLPVMQGDAVEIQVSFDVNDDGLGPTLERLPEWDQ